MTIYRDKQSGYWTVQDGNAKHKRKAWNKADAEAFAESLRDKQAQWGASGVLTDKEYREALEWRDEAAEAGCTVREAIRFWSEHNQAVEKMAVPEAVEKFIEDGRDANLRESSLKNLSSTLGPDALKHPKCFAAWFSNKQCHELTLETIKEWVDSHNWLIATKRRMYWNVSAFIKFCIGRNFMLVNPLRHMKRIRVDNKPAVILSVDKCREVLNYVIQHDPGMLPYTAVRLFGGLRTKEAERIFSEPEGTESAVFKPDFIKLTDTHAKRTRSRHSGRKVPINDTLRAWLEVAPPVFPLESWARRWHKIHKACGVPRNAIRHTTTTFALQKLGEVATSNQLGHSIDTLHQKYKGELDDPMDVERFWNLTPKELNYVHNCS